MFSAVFKSTSEHLDKAGLSVGDVTSQLSLTQRRQSCRSIISTGSKNVFSENKVRHLVCPANMINTASKKIRDSWYLESALFFGCKKHYQQCTSSSRMTSSPSCAWLFFCLSSLSAAASSSLASWSSSAFDSFLRMMMEACKSHVGHINMKPKKRVSAGWLFTCGRVNPEAAAHFCF